MGLLFEMQERLTDRFDMNKDSGQLDQDVVFYTFLFESQFEEKNGFLDIQNFRQQGDELRSDLFSVDNPENHFFRYAVFVPVKRQENAKALFLLHGLNERRWDKYLLWAYQLTIKTGAPVILFPLANHINRAPDLWSYPRKMIEVVRNRKDHFGAIKNSSFANVALSSRIDRNPEVFVTSGIQSFMDIVKLTGEISSGQHPLFFEGTKVDFFSYSIGAFMTELLLMSNPQGLYSFSKAFLFCGGSTLDQMDARSKSILDNKAVESLQRFMSQIEDNKTISRLFEVLKPFGCSVKDVFLSMLAIDRFKAERENFLRILSRRIRAFGLSFDKVIPGNAIRQTFGGDFHNVTIADFDFQYSHEIPFPFTDFSVSSKVEHAFRKTFQEASFFLK